MTTAPPDLGDLRDLAQAIGLVTPTGALNTDWFGDPGKFTGRMFRDPAQRQALLRALDALLGDDADLFVDQQGRTWVPVIRKGGIALHLVVESTGGATVVGVGARLTTTKPVSTTDVMVPLVRIPDDGKAVQPVPGTAAGRIRARTDIQLTAAAPAPGKAGMAGLVFDADVAADGTDPRISVVLRGLQLPGEQAAHDLVVDVTGSPSALGDQAVKLVVGVVQSSAASATGSLAELLALIGLTSDPAIPALPVAGILQRGLVAWREWLSELLNRPDALPAWLGHLAALVGTGLGTGPTAAAGVAASPVTTTVGPAAPAGAVPTVESPKTPGAPHRIAWTLANGLTVAATVRVGATTAGAAEIELGVQASAERAVAPVGGVELDAVLARITLGAAPSVRALPRLTLLGRAGPATGTPMLLDVTAPQVGSTPAHPVRVRSLRAGFALDGGRRPVFVLAAHDVTVAAHTYPVLDLTSAQTLADVGQAALGDIADDLLGRLGAAELPVRVLLGLISPPGQPAWPVPLTALTDLLANPVTAVAGYHQRVLSTHRAGYAAVLAPLGGLLLSEAGGPLEALASGAVASDVGRVRSVIGGDGPGGASGGDSGSALGDEARPWQLALTDGVALTVWADPEPAGELHVGVLVERSVADLGGGCPTVGFTARADLASIRLATRSARMVTAVNAELRFGGLGGVPLRLGDDDAALVASTVGLRLTWNAGGPLRAALVAPDLVAEVGARRASIELPSVSTDGSFTAAPPWNALELLSGNVLRRTGAAWATATADLLGWAAPTQVGPVTRARLPLQDLVADPARAARGWALGIGVATIAGWLATLLAGQADTGIGPAPGRGDVDAPHAVPVKASAAGAARAARLLLWDRAGVRSQIEPFQPGLLIGFLTSPPGTGTAPSAEQLAAALRLAAAAGPRAAEVLDGRPGLAAGLAALQARWIDSDGLVPTAAVTLPRAATHDLDGVAHGDLPGLVDLAALGVPAGAAAVFVTGPFGPPAWPGIPDDHVLDLTAPGLPVEAFDVTPVATTDGPWAVRLPRRVDAVVSVGEDGFARQAARLARVVDAAAARAAAKPLALIGFGAAGHAAAAVAGRPGVTHLVTVGTPHGGLNLDILDASPGGDALRLLAGIVPDANPQRPDHPMVNLGRGMLTPLLAASENGTPLADLAPPAAPPAIPTTVSIHCVRGNVASAATARALTGLVVRGLQQLYETGADPVRDGVPGAPSLGWGVALRLSPAVPAAGVRVRAELALMLPGPGTTARAGRGLRVRFDVDRVGGWLVGGPIPNRAPGPRGTELRRATLELTVPFGAIGTAGAGGTAGQEAVPSSRILVHEGTALGVRRTRWELTGSGDPMTAEARALVGALAAALGPLPATGPVRDLVDLLTAVGVTEPGTSVGTGAAVSMSVEGIRRFLLDPGGLLRQAPQAPLAAVLARITGAPAPSTATPTRFAFDVDGLSVSADRAAGTLRVQTGSTGLPFAAGAVLRGSLDLTGAGALTGSAEINLGGGLTLTLGTAPAPFATLLLADGGGPGNLPASVALHPEPDGPGLRRLVAAAAPAQVLWAGITFIRSLRQPGVDALVDPLLTALRLLRPDGRVVVPLTLLAEPGRWFRRLAAGNTGALVGRAGAAAAAGGGAPTDAFAAAFDALGAVLGVPSARPGVWRLPYGLEAGIATGGTAGPGGPRVNLSLSLATAQQAAGLLLTGSASLLAGGGAAPVPQASATLAIPGATGRLTVAAGAAGVTARLQVPSLPLDVVLLPPGAGLAGTAGQAALHALPHVLDALATLPTSAPTLPAIGTLGDALGLRVNGSFSGDQLAALAAAPGPQLAARLAANLGPGLTALRGLLAPMLPATLALAASGTALTLTRAEQNSFTVALTVPSVAGLRVVGSLTGRTPFPGATLDADLAADAAGLSAAHVVLAVPASAPLTLGPLHLAPRIEISTAAPQLSVGLGVPGAVVAGVLRVGPPRIFSVEATGLPLTDALVRLLLPIAADLALSTAELQQLLGRATLGTTVKALLEGVVFAGGVLDQNALVPANLFSRLLRLGVNIGKAPKAPALQVSPLSVQLASRTEGTGTSAVTFLGLSVTLPPGQRFDLVSGDVTVQVEVDGTWVRPAGLTPGLTIEVLRTPATGSPTPSILVALRGMGIRIGRATGPLLDGFVVTDTIAAHGLIEVSGSGVAAAGGQLEVAGLRMPVGSATGGGNAIASGILRDSASGSASLAPKFSPALAVQRRDGKLRVDLRAGEGDGPWFIPIQRGFGPVYVEQVGFGVTRANDRVTAARIVVDGNVELLGLVVAVQELGLTAPWPQAAGAAPPTNPASWAIGLEGLAVAATTGGVSISGGLRRIAGADYEGMISLRFGPYGITAYGGYAVKDDFTSLFIFGALNAPIGGPPAFFLTGIGAGVGVNRLLKLPPSLAELPAYPLVQALDPHAPSNQDPMVMLAKLGTFFPPERGAFWFAAGVSFTSFALVDCVAVLAVAVADGLEITLMGLARAALPTTAAPLAQLELALLARFSTRDGVLWVQAQLTDNSWLLTKDIRLTGGFAYVSWFSGDKAGEFVLTVGGFHPSFHRDGYPVVPRVGYRWGVSKFLVIKGETYFAITSEAIMAGTRLEASLTLGPLWAYLRLGADGIVFFDPFRFEVTAFAELGAGITVDIDLLFGHIRFTIGFHLHAQVTIAGPNFHGTASIDLGVTSATIAFGDPSGPPALPLPWEAFAAKYLQAGQAPVISAVAGRGQLPPSTGGNKKPPTGASGDPFLVLPEFELTVTTTAATGSITAGGVGMTPIPGADPLAIGPMQLAAITSTLVISVTSVKSGTEHAPKFTRTATIGQFPKGIWGPNLDDAAVPTGDTLTAGTGVTLLARVSFGPQVATLKYHQVEVGTRKPNPLLAALAGTPKGLAAVEVAARAAAETAVRRQIGAADTAEAAFDQALAWLETGPNGRQMTPGAAALFRARRAAPPRLVPADRGLGSPLPPPVDVPVTRTEDGPDAEAPGLAFIATARDGRRHPRLRRPGLPAVAAVLTFAPSADRPRPRTTVGAAGDGVPRVAPPRGGPAAVGGAELDVRAATVPPGRNLPGDEVRRGVAVGPRARAELAERADAVSGAGLDVPAGELVLLQVTGAEWDAAEERRPGLVLDAGSLRIVALDTTGGVVLDRSCSANPAHGLPTSVTLPLRTARVALLGGGAAGGHGAASAAGWAAGSTLAQIGGRALIGPGCTIESTTMATTPTRRQGRRVTTGFVRAATAVDGFSVVTTRLPTSTTAVAIALERDQPDGDADAAPGDLAVELGITGATPGEPIPVRDGATTVYPVTADPDAEQLVVTVASGRGLDLAGVLGVDLEATQLAALLRDGGIAGLLGAVVPRPDTGAARVRWVEVES